MSNNNINIYYSITIHIYIFYRDSNFIMAGGRPKRQKYRRSVGRPKLETVNEIPSVVDNNITEPITPEVLICEICIPDEERDDDNEYVILRKGDLRNVINKHCCYKKSVSHGMTTLLKDFAAFAQTNINSAIDEIKQINFSNVRTSRYTRRWKAQEKLLDMDFNMKMLSNTFVREKCHPSRFVYLRLGDKYIDNLEMNFNSVGIACNVEINVITNRMKK